MVEIVSGYSLEGFSKISGLYTMGSPPHFSLNVRNRLNQQYPNKWIGKPVNWPPRSPDLNPLDYFLWGYLKPVVYKADETNNLIHYNKVVQQVQWNFLRSMRVMVDSLYDLYLFVFTFSQHILPITKIESYQYFLFCKR